MKIYHYTSANGILGIAKSQSLWATHFKYLNDQSEFYHAKEIISKIITESKHKLVQKHKGTAIVCLNQIYQIYDIYTCSFSKKPDHLSQWRAYCPSNGGFSVGFNVENLMHLNGDNFLECIYREEEKLELVAKLIERFCENCEKLVKDEKIIFSSEWNKRFETINIAPYSESPKRNPLDLEKNHTEIRYELALLAARMKDVSFEEENEVRYIEIVGIEDHSRLIYRNKNSLIIPYKLMQINDSSIELITLGPSLDQELNIHSLNSIKSNYHLKFSIEKSPIPYRGW